MSQHNIVYICVILYLKSSTFLVEAPKCGSISCYFLKDEFPNGFQNKVTLKDLKFFAASNNTITFLNITILVALTLILFIVVNSWGHPTEIITTQQFQFFDPVSAGEHKIISPTLIEPGDYCTLIHHNHTKLHLGLSARLMHSWENDRDQSVLLKLFALFAARNVYNVLNCHCNYPV